MNTSIAVPFKVYSLFGIGSFWFGLALVLQFCGCTAPPDGLRAPEQYMKMRNDNPNTEPLGDWTFLTTGRGEKSLPALYKDK